MPVTFPKQRKKHTHDKFLVITGGGRFIQCGKCGMWWDGSRWRKPE